MADAPDITRREVKMYVDKGVLWFYDNGWKTVSQAAEGAPQSANPIVLSAGATSYVVPAGSFVLAIVFNDPLLPNVSIGLSPVTKEISSDYQLETPEEAVSINKPFPEATTVYFIGVHAGTIIKIYKL